MCAIIGSSDLNTLKELIELNSYRGSHSYSFSLFNTYSNTLHVLKRKLGTINLDSLFIPANSYCIVHIQAPTTDAKDVDSIHPAAIPGTTSEFPDMALWHNGIIKEDTVKENAIKYGTSWDTAQILKALKVNNHSWNILNDFDGTFSCLYFNRLLDRLVLFRNEISPMFIDDKLNISSTRFSGSKETEPNVVFEMDLQYNRLINVGEFRTVENPYFFGE